MSDIPQIEESKIQGTGIVSDIIALSTKRAVIKKLWFDDTQYVPLIDECLKSPEKGNIFDLLSMIIKLTYPGLQLIYYITKFLLSIKDGIMTQSTIDTVKGIVRALLVILAVFGVKISPQDTETILMVVGGIFAVVEIILGAISNSKMVKPAP